MLTCSRIVWVLDMMIILSHHRDYCKTHSQSLNKNNNIYLSNYSKQHLTSQTGVLFLETALELGVCLVDCLIAFCFQVRLFYFAYLVLQVY